MALTVNFWQFSKPENSTAIPGGSPAASFSCSLKSESGILKPTLEIGLPMTANPIPAAFNYAQIPAYSRYYHVLDWQWSEGLWLCSLEVDPLASWRSYIGASSHYVLRAAADYEPAIVDDLYPALARRPEFISALATFPFEAYEDGIFVVGIAARDANSGPVTYYSLTIAQMNLLISYMMPSGGDWFSSFTSFTDTLYRSVYDPFSYIKSCRWFPLSYTPGLPAYVRFGNYIAVPASTGDPEARGHLLPTDSSQWPIYRAVLPLPAGWRTMDAKYKTPPYGDLHLVFNPFGIIELNPLDFSNGNSVSLELMPDFISGDALLKIYKRTNEGDFFITEKSARLSLDIPLSATSQNVLGVLSGVTMAASGFVAGVSAKSAEAMLTSAFQAAAGVGYATAAAIPTLASGTGAMAGGPRPMDGVANLIFTSTDFAPDDNTDHGKPLCDTRVLSTLPGYIKCADGHISIPGYSEEIDAINQYLAGGFYYV